ncbi:MutS-related protein [Pleomorphovibrio marinus]|uniref:MutS-related protein n=1 Tax=Pleomorphovibrio marinus TaxID=2164132 RepID=UPI000E0CB4C1|nr:DNA mismatch repair protein [Pleomorphovibrio marinus]
MFENLDFSQPEAGLVKIRKVTTGLSIARFLVFLALLAVLVVGISDQNAVFFLFIPLAFLFIWLIVKFNEKKDEEGLLKSVVLMKEAREKRMRRELAGFDKGEEFLDKSHPYASDLDLFGAHSLFQLLDHTVSPGGKSKLANFMLHQATPKVAMERHEALKELSGKGEFLLLFEGLGKAFLKNEKEKSRFFDWLAKPNAWKKGYWIPAILGPTVGLAVLVYTFLLGYPYVYLSMFIGVGLLLLSLVFRPLMEAMKNLPNEQDLKTYRLWAKLLENQSFKHPLLQKFQKPYVSDGFKASKALKALEGQIFVVQNRANLMYLVFNLFFWLDFLVLFRLEKWKRRYGEHFSKWQQTFDTWQALASLGAFTAEEQLDGEIIWEEGQVWEGKGIKHPLIREEKCVDNDFELPMGKKIILLTGSNMSGKTTFMRTMGINLVMVHMGLSPMARSLRIGNFKLYTSMRNTDNLGESVSSFYAELSRIKGLLEQTDMGVPVFFLLDEILKGTNTKDRIMGSEALIRQLMDKEAMGIISTHDIELSELEAKLPALGNRSFHHLIKENEILFDYKIKQGPCPDFNANKLMELMGINFKP